MVNEKNRILFLIGLVSLLIFSHILPLNGSLQRQVMAEHNKHSTEAEPKKSKSIDFPAEYEEQKEWIVKWKEGAAQPKSDLFVVLEADPERRLLLVELKPTTSIDQWYMTWSQKKEIEYVEPNLPMKISTRPNDPEYTKQTYLRSIRAEEGWKIERENKQVTIAILDTGVDLQHPDLKDQLVSGVNMIDSKKSAQDDNGHGTQIAGVLGARSNNNEGISGILWSTKIMPIKVLDHGGEGKPFTVSQGIYYAIDKGVSIVLLSLGDRIYTKTMQEAVELAEEKGILVIAATGNEGGRVNYPAAFPTVLGVGALTPKQAPASYSNSGPETGVVAMGDVYTTQLRGKYGPASGTSMAAPQVAGLAALIMKKYPRLTVSEVRNHIYYTSRDVHSRGWDTQTGHGLIDIGKALQTEPVADIYEPNNSLNAASMFPIETMIRAELRNKEDEDWFKIEAPYRGKIEFNVKVDMLKNDGIDLSFFPSGKSANSQTFNVKKERKLTVTIPKGTSYIKVKYNQKERRPTPLGYEIVSEFTIYEDAQQPNDTRSQATRMDGKGKVYTGTFHKDGLMDWYYMDVPKKGEIDLQVTVDTVRIDPVIIIETPDSRSLKVDEGNVNNGQEERWIQEVEPGRYYFRVNHYYGHKVNGEYYLRLNYRPFFEDPYEPNNTKDLATRIQLGSFYEANIHQHEDIDLYRVQVAKENYLNISLADLPPHVGLHASLLGQDMKPITSYKQRGNESSFSLGDKVKPGVYFIQIIADKPFKFNSYKLQATEQELIQGFRDIKGHWAEQEIVKAARAGIISGMGDYRFQPNGTMTRATTAVILQRVYQYPKPSSSQRFKDVSTAHWAYDSIDRVSGALVMRGFKDGTFGLEQSLTRAEVAVIFDRILLLEQGNISIPEFKDVPKDHWAYSSVMRLAEAGLLRGDKAGTFRPNQAISRAEFVTLMNRIQAK